MTPNMLEDGFGLRPPSWRPLAIEYLLIFVWIQLVIRMAELREAAWDKNLDSILKTAEHERHKNSYDIVSHQF